ncbi:MAG: hypothetical protein AYL28_004940 [Candidatus Bathyarchaeota archaeon B23]|nr:MAG: hypothetical protein AYL28_004940 [Candidatus Bathyarchaeota archaeon B23]
MILVGTCGWSRLYEFLSPKEREGRPLLEAYAKLFPVAEVNSSFYRFHRPSTYRGWRHCVPEKFEFTIKCHRSITHEELLKPTERALEAMERMYEAAEACNAWLLLLQTPTSLRPSEEAFRGAEAFFEEVSREAFQLAWETRGSAWEEAGARRRLSSLLERFDLIHVTDPLKLMSASLGETAYFRLHGLTVYNLRYSYTNAQLLELRRRLEALEAKRIYVFFNNYAMYRDAYRFLKLLREGEPPPSPFGPASLYWALRGFDDWPASRETLLERCGRWRCWVKPSKAVPLERILRHLSEGTYGGVEELVEEAVRLWGKLGYPSADEVEAEAF